MQRVGTVAEGQEKETEHRDPVEGPPGPVDPRAEVPRECLGKSTPTTQHRGNREDVTALATRVTRPTTTQATWAINTMSKAGLFG